MARPKKLINAATPQEIISNATYNPMGQLLTMTGVGGAPSETRTYNSLGQMTQLQSGQFLTIQYNFHATQNNGKIVSEVQSGETVQYNYDSLNRLASAESSLNPGWGQAFTQRTGASRCARQTLDGFGNLTNVSVTKGTAPSMSASYNPATNRRTTEYCADANGNLDSQDGFCWNASYRYDVDNRLAVANISGGGTERYSYAPNNQRVWRGVFTGNPPNATQTVNEITFYAPGGAKLAVYKLAVPGYTTSSSYYEYFGGKLLKNAQGWVTPDRLGSHGKFFPYGQERPSATPEGTEKFATYFRDENTGLDYAQNRYYKPGEGRFMTPDPYLASGGPADPGSWNRYAYVEGDLVNYFDPTGLQKYCGRDATGEPVPCPPPSFPTPANCPTEFWKAECGGAGIDGTEACLIQPDICAEQPSNPGVDAAITFLQQEFSEVRWIAVQLLIDNEACASLFHGADPVKALLGNYEDRWVFFLWTGLADDRLAQTGQVSRCGMDPHGSSSRPTSRSI